MKHSPRMLALTLITLILVQLFVLVPSEATALASVPSDRSLGIVWSVLGRIGPATSYGPERVFRSLAGAVAMISILIAGLARPNTIQSKDGLPWLSELYGSRAWRVGLTIAAVLALCAHACAMLAGHMTWALIELTIAVLIIMLVRYDMDRSRGAHVVVAVGISAAAQMWVVGALVTGFAYGVLEVSPAILGVAFVAVATFLNIVVGWQVARGRGSLWLRVVDALSSRGPEAAVTRGLEVAHFGTFLVWLIVA